MSHASTLSRPSPCRSEIRRRLGRLYFIWKRRLVWRFGGADFAREQGAALPCTAFRHQSVILRPLKRLDMRLQENKRVNLGLAARRLSGLLLKPGQTFSFWRLVGKPVRRAGYLDGLVLSQGALREGVGGGLCQLSNLIYWMALHTPLAVTERWRHSFDVFPDADRTQPFGSGATVAYNYIDLQIFNPTAQTFQLDVWLDQTHLNGAWRCENPLESRYRVYEKGHRIESCPLGGYLRHNELYRSVTPLSSLTMTGENADATPREEFITENHAFMLYNPMLEASPCAVG